MEAASRATTSTCLWTGILLLSLAGTAASSQSLAEVAKREKERRAALKGRSIQRDTNLPKPRTPAPAASSEKVPAPAISAPVGASPQPSPASSLPQASTSTNGSTVVVDSTEELPPPAEVPSRPSGSARRDGNWRGTFSLDWVQTQEAAVATQLSGRVKLEAGQRPGDGWRALIDLRDRFHGGPRANHRAMLYDARLTYDHRERPLGLSIGRLNLYDSAGAGPLLGGVFSYRAGPSLSAGTYGGIEPETYLRVPDGRSQKYGFFTLYSGPYGRSLAASYNLIRVRGVNERQFLYATGLFPLPERAVVFGSLEYELEPKVASQDRLSRFFLNARYDLSPSVDVTTYASSGRGLDYRRFVLAQVENRRLDFTEVRRFYYSQQLGARVQIRPSRQWSVFVAQALSEQKDRGIRNHTTELGGSLLDFSGSGLSLYGSFHVNRGASAESNSYRLSMSRDFGGLSWTGTYSSVFAGIQLDPATGVPELLSTSDRQAVSNELFWVLHRSLAFSVEHELATGVGDDENTFFVRMMGRF